MALNRIQKNMIDQDFVKQVDDQAAQLAQIAISADNWNLVGDGVVDESDNILALLKSDYENIVFPANKVYRITKHIIVDSGVNKTVNLNGSKILFVLPQSGDGVRFRTNVEFENGVFDFNNGNINRGLHYSSNLGDISLHNIVFQNVNDKNIESNTYPLLIEGKGNKFYSDKITFKNLKKIGIDNLPEGDSSLFTGVLFAQAIEGGYIKEINIENVYRVKEDGTPSNASCNVIQFAGEDGGSDKFTIDKINGVEFGRRLLKAQINNLTIGEVNAVTNTGVTLTALGLLNRNTVRTSNIHVGKIDIKGKMEIGCVISADDVYIGDVIIDIQPNTPTQPSYSFNFIGDNTYINKAKLKSKIIFTSNRTPTYNDENVRDITINDLIAYPGDGRVFLWDNPTFKGVESLTINKAAIFCVGNPVSSPFIFDNVEHGNINIKQLTFKQIGGTQPFTLFSFRNMRNIKLGNIDINVESELFRVFSILDSDIADIQNITGNYITQNRVIELSRVKNYYLNNIQVNEGSQYGVGVSASKGFIGITDLSKILFHEPKETSRDVAKIIQTYTPSE